MNILTIITLAYLAGMTLFAARRGFFRSVFSMVFLGVVILAMQILTPAVTDVFRSSHYVTEYVNRQSAAIIAAAGSGEAAAIDITQVRSPQDVARAVVAIAMRTASVEDQGAEVISSVIINTIAAAATLFLSLLIGLIARVIIYRFLHLTGGGPLDHLLGAPIGLVRGLITVWIGLGFIQLLGYTGPFDRLAAQISESPVLMWLSRNNLLAVLLAKIVTRNA
ncbi:MAG: CvpA family protein [Lachnospiraceae bacterium]|nr:CvpA family protein [Lachnospiraceae bacterium]